MLTQDSIEMHFLRYSLERMNAPVLEAQARASHEITHCARHHRFARLRFRRNASRNVYGNSSDVVALHLNFASMQTAAYSDAKWSHRFGNRGSASHRSRRAVKSRHKPVAEIFDFMPSKSRDLLPHRLVMEIEQRAPFAVAEFASPLCRIDNVGEHNGRQHPISLDIAAA